MFGKRWPCLLRLPREGASTVAQALFILDGRNLSIRLRISLRAKVHKLSRMKRMLDCSNDLKVAVKKKEVDLRSFWFFGWDCQGDKRWFGGFN